jgi:hypothetical protein
MPPFTFLLPKVLINLVLGNASFFKNLKIPPSPSSLVFVQDNNIEEKQQVVINLVLGKPSFFLKKKPYSSLVFMQDNNIE